MQPLIGATVHYVSYGTPGGEYASQCRAAIISDVPNYPEGGDANGNMVSLAVLNPAGLFFDRAVPYVHPGDGGPVGGTWHWPEGAA